MAELTSSDGLLRWLFGGLVAGALLLCLLVAAYEIGYHHGKGKVGSPTLTTTAPETTPGSSSPVALGKRLFTADACASCHSLTGASGEGPTVKGLAGSMVELSNGRSVTADDAYLTKAITDPDAELVKGYQKGIMSTAISSFGLTEKPQDVAALVAFIKAQR
jgi:cytochrome c oxidase subunit 2